MMVASVFQRPTLVLNRSRQPVNVATVGRALAMLWTESARVVNPNDYQSYDWSDWSRLAPYGDEPFIQAARSQVRVPEAVALSTYDRLPAAAVSFNAVKAAVVVTANTVKQFRGTAISADPAARGVDVSGLRGVVEKNGLQKE